MRTTLLLTAIGADRTGLVESLAHRIASAGANWEECRLSRLAGQFAGIVLVTVDAERTETLIASLRELAASGLQVTSQPVTPLKAAPTGTRIRLHITGADRPGIVRDVSRILVEHGIKVDELESTIGSAPMSGEAMFEAEALLLVPSTVSLPTLRSALEVLGNELMVDLTSDDPSPQT